MKQNKKITDIFKTYFEGKVSLKLYSDMYESLREIEKLVNIYKNPLGYDNERLRDFVESFYNLKRVLQERYRLSIEKNNSIEEQIKPLKIRLWDKMERRNILTLYSNCNKFEQIMILKYNIYMAGIDQQIQQ